MSEQKVLVAGELELMMVTATALAGKRSRCDHCIMCSVATCKHLDASHYPILHVDDVIRTTLRSIPKIKAKRAPFSQHSPHHLLW
eukprot:514241-Amphidinium_carterae.1